MSPLLQAGGLSFLAVSLVVLGLKGPIDAWIERRRLRAEDMRQQLHRDRIVTGSVLGWPLLAAAIVLVGTISGHGAIAIPVGIAIFLLLDAIPKWLRKRRLERFDEQLPDALGTMSNALKAGYALAEAVRHAGESLPAPAGQEFARIHAEYTRGSPILDAMESARTRIGSRNFNLAVAAFRVGQQQGGNTAEVFERIEASIREIWKVEQEIKTATTKGRQSARIMTLMPLAFFFVLRIIDPGAVDILLNDFLGNLVLAVVIIMNILCHMWIRRIITVEV